MRATFLFTAGYHRLPQRRMGWRENFDDSNGRDFVHATAQALVEPGDAGR
ncbi:MAG: hypothetical protein ACRDZ4_14820 [Egibacteraceae bacterium]